MEARGLFHCVLQGMCISWLLVLGGLVEAQCARGGGNGQAAPRELEVGFYHKRCPMAESVMFSVVAKAFTRNSFIAGGLLRLVFHDCFVRGCDASVLLDSVDGAKAEKDGQGVILRGLEVIDEAKAKLEAACPGVVSCADVIAFASRDSVVVTGGPHWRVEAGRRDGTASIASEAGPPNLPLAFQNASQIAQIFEQKGFSREEMVVLSGAHTIGEARCNTFSKRLQTDPTLDERFRQSLVLRCPDSNNVTLEAIDRNTPVKFDNSYYTNLVENMGLLTSDQTLFTDDSTHDSVIKFARNQDAFFAKFVGAMVRLGRLGVLTGNQGEIRSNCRRINSCP